MKLPLYRVNIGYEYNLHNNINEKIKHKIFEQTQNFEFVYFFIEKNKSRLLCSRNYPQDYLDYISSNLGLKLPELVHIEDKLQKETAHDWWGNSENFELARKLNSKVTSTEIALKEGLCPEGVVIINEFNDLQKHLSKYNSIKDWILKGPLSMSGGDTKIFSPEDLQNSKLIKYIKELLKNDPVIISPFFQRELDFGSHYGLERPFIFFNLNSKAGSFKGGIIYSSKANELEEALFYRFGYSFSRIIEKIDLIVSEYIKLGAKDIIQIDSFLYKGIDQCKFYPLVEVNCRKTMGTFAYSMRPYLPLRGMGLLILINSNDLHSINSYNELIENLEKKRILYDFDKKFGAIPPAPLGGSVFPLFLVAMPEEMELLFNMTLETLVKNPELYSQKRYYNLTPFI